MVFFLGGVYCKTQVIKHAKQEKGLYTEGTLAKHRHSYRHAAQKLKHPSKRQQTGRKGTKETKQKPKTKNWPTKRNKSKKEDQPTNHQPNRAVKTT